MSSLSTLDFCRETQKNFY